MRHHGGETFPPPSPAFASKKIKILNQLAVPDAEYTDASPKGTVDKGIRHLIDEINGAEGFVTTSSCAGRVSVFLEGRKAVTTDAYADGNARVSSQVAGVGGKGAGGKWLFVSHDPVDREEWARSLNLSNDGSCETAKEKRLIHFKFEPMILHVLAASPTHAQVLLQSALQAGFRESGALNITTQADCTATPIVAVRSTGLSFESLIGYEVDGIQCSLVQETHLRMLMDIANERFSENAKRIARFREAFWEMVLEPRRVRLNPEGKQWENVATRRERMREEGLARKLALREGSVENGDEKQNAVVEAEDFDLPS
ncbi:hypothetical protein EsDP_00006097 [Epichloe bromicola]|uniref:tRNA(Phe) 7-[(3-amino-3-carboxypropyl)-4-demethylwyosine(37)-N(4)]-methyltransferase n=1 Tax=Epichloe bromicola TaxID=79588 RepID=A0ABQ0CWL1_9HYPO